MTIADLDRTGVTFKDGTDYIETEDGALRGIGASSERVNDPANEPGTQLYQAWQAQADETSFLHLFIFADEEARRIHSELAAVARFEAVYAPELVGGDVAFTDFDLVARNDAP